MTFLKPVACCFVLVFMLVACNRPVPVLEGIDLAAWKNDKGGCDGKRVALIKPLEEQKNKLLGLSEMQILDVLGRPDQNELYKRNQKFYLYNLEPGKACGTDRPSRTLSVRFNATGRAKEITIE